MDPEPRFRNAVQISCSSYWRGEKRKKEKQWNGNECRRKIFSINGPPICRFRSLVRRKLLLGGRREKEKGETYQESVGQFVSSGAAGEKTVTGGKERNWNVCGWCMRIYLKLTAKLNLFSVYVCVIFNERERSNIFNTVLV